MSDQPKWRQSHMYPVQEWDLPIWWIPEGSTDRTMNDAQRPRDLPSFSYLWMPQSERPFPAGMMDSPPPKLVDGWFQMADLEDRHDFPVLLARRSNARPGELWFSVDRWTRRDLDAANLRVAWTPLPTAVFA